jgi:hypothetical protein
MTTTERLAVLETKVELLASDVAEVKGDVKTLMNSVNTLSSSLQSNERAALARDRSRSDLGIWVRSAIPWAIASGALALGILNLFIHDFGGF